MLTIIGSALGLLGALVTGGVALWLRNKAAANTPTEKENAVAARDAEERVKVADEVAEGDVKDFEEDISP